MAMFVLVAEHDIEIIEASRELVSTTDRELDRLQTIFVGDVDYRA